MKLPAARLVGEPLGHERHDLSSPTGLEAEWLKSSRCGVSSEITA